MTENEAASVPHLNMTKHCLTAEYYADLCPPLSRFCIRLDEKQLTYMKSWAENQLSRSNVEEIKAYEAIASSPPHVCCASCGNLYRPGNHKVKVLPKMKLSTKIQKLRRKVSSKGEQSLGKFQRKLLQNFEDSRTKVVMLCLCCKKKTVIPCPHKPEKIQPPQVQQANETTKKSSRKKLKQKRRRANQQLEEDELETAAKKNSSSSVLKKVQKTIKPACPFPQPALGRKTSVPLSFQSSLQTDSIDNKLATSKKKAKAKDVHKTLHKMLQKEKQDSTVSKNSLQSFLSSL